MKTKKLFTSLAAAVILSTSLAGSGAVLSQTAHAADTTQTASTNSQAKKGTMTVKYRTVTATIKNTNPTLYTIGDDGKTLKPVTIGYTKGQAIQLTYIVPTSGKNKVYAIEGTMNVNGKDVQLFVPETEVTVSGTVPTFDDAVINNRDLKYIVVTPKSKKGAKIYYAYKKTKKSKKIYFFKASKKKIKKGKKFKSSMIVKHGKTRYVYIGKKRYVKQSAVKLVSAKYAPVKLSDELKNLLEENKN
ncbi:hypothetical protein [uncultured Lactobacillus sp.]|jgi:hypothetical protein|uniref:hypothetical protein n=1 Tax=uncultured Lactobacillus sp. TaxID=153152 RepID=UPI00258CBF2C|nr:hypothetical protein [uncultured Lactobacillus sp.]